MSQNKLYVLPQEFIRIICACAKKRTQTLKNTQTLLPIIMSAKSRKKQMKWKLCIFRVVYFFQSLKQSVRASWGKTYNLFWPALFGSHLGIKWSHFITFASLHDYGSIKIIFPLTCQKVGIWSELGHCFNVLHFV